jgi:hypothetical protein
MRKYFIVLLILILVQKTTSALPVIDNVSVNPQSLWLGESPIISLNCYDNENKTITSVYANTSGPGIILPRLDFTGVNPFTGNYNQFKTYLDRVGNYDVIISCNNNESQSTHFSTSFTISKLTGLISFIDSIGYIGDEIEIDFLVKKDDVVLSSGVSFNITLNDQLKQLKVPPAYDLSKGWVLKLDSPSTEGTYNVKVYAYYNRTNVSNSSSINIMKRIDFGVVSLSKNWVNGNENITLSLKAKDMGNIIDVNKNNLNIQIASTSVNILSIDKSGDLYNVRITVPSLSAGTYELRSTLSYEGSVYSDTKSIDYIVEVKGKIVDNNNKGINTQIKFFSGNLEKLRLSTDSTGYYSSSIPPGTYDIQVIFPQSTLYLDYVSISYFNDPIKYFYSNEDLVSGIRSAGLFGYEVALDYDEANIEMNYDEKNLLDETQLTIFKCSNWNSGRKTCNGNWFEVYGDFDTVRNLAKLNLTSLSAFVVGERKAINVNFNLDSERYYTESVVKIIGLVKDLDGSNVDNATVKMYVKNTEIKINTSSDNNGVFSIEFKAPKNEGNYTLVLSAEKPPYISFSGSKNFDVIKSRTVEILIPDTIKLKQGQSFTQEVSIVNTGQANLLNLNISLTGIPTNYFNLTNFIGRLNENEENKIFIYFSIPENAEKKTYGATLEVSNSEIKQERVFGFTVVNKNETVDIQSTPAGRFILPKLDSNSVYIIVFAVAVFSIAIFLKKMKIKKSKRNDVKDFLSDVKDSLRYRKTEMTTNLKNVSDYRDLIKSEFPNAFKNKDKYGKNN